MTTSAHPLDRPRGGFRIFSNLSLRIKLILVFLVMTLLAVGIIALLNIRSTSAALTTQVGEGLAGLAGSEAHKIEAVMTEHVEAMQAFTPDSAMQAAIAAQNATYSGGTEAILAELTKLDEQWIATSDDDALIQKRVPSEQAEELGDESLATELAQITEIIPGFSEVFVTDRYGGLVAASERTSDYYQADEDWWQAAYNNGQGTVYISEPELDESAGTIGVSMAVPVFDQGNEVVGILRATLDATELVSRLATLELGETGRADLLVGEGLLEGMFGALHEGHEDEIHGGIDPAALAQMAATPEGYVETILNGQPALIGYAQVSSPTGEQFISDLGWKVIVHQDQDEALAVVADQTRNTGLLTLGIAGIVVVVAIAMGQMLSSPIARLTSVVTRFTEGDLSARIDIDSRDETGVLAVSFNHMAEQLGKLLTDIQVRTAELEERTRELEASQGVTFAASERTSPEELLGLVVDLVRDQFDVYHVQMYIVDEKQQAAVLHESTGYAGSQLLQSGHQIPLAQTTLVTKAINENQPMLVDDTGQDPNFMPNPLLPETRTELVVPLRVGDRVLGALDIQDRTPGRFSENTVNLFEAMTDQVAFLFENNELLERVTDQTESLTAFTTQLRTASDIAEQLSTVLDPEQMLHEMAELVQSRFGLYHAHIYVLNEAKRQLTVRAGSGEVGRVLRERGHSIPLDAEKSLVARAARSGEPVLVEDTSLESDFMPNPLLPQTRSELAVPLVVGERALGVLDIQDDQADRFAQTDVDTFSTLAGLAAGSLQNANLFEERARLLAEVDQIFNTSADAMRVVDKDFNMLRVNQTFATLTGVSVDEAAGKKCYDAFSGHACHTDDCPLTRILGGEESYEYEIEKERRDGTRVPCIAAAAPFKGPDGELIGIVEDFRDITERVRAEQELRRLGIAMEQSVDGIAVADMNGVMLFVNAAWAQMHGYSVEEILGKPLSIFHTEEQIREEVNPFNEQVIATGSNQGEMGHARKDGTTFPTWMTIALLTDKEGKPIGLAGTARDITEQKKAEQALQESEERFRNLSDASEEGIAIHEQGVIVDANVALARMFGYEHSEVIGMEIEKLVTPESWKTIVPRIAAGYDKPYEAVGVKKDGSTLICELVGKPYAYQGKDLRLAVARDITERVRAEEEIRKRAVELQTVAEVSTAAATILEPGELLQTVTDLTKNNFGLYHAHIYLLDEVEVDGKLEDTLVLASGAGEAGRQMVAEGWRIPLEREASLVARAARTRQGVIANDVQQAPDYMPNPLLPDTRSELAVPMIVGDRVLGVLDVQSDTADHFTDEDVQIQTILAGQIATALQNADLFERTQVRLKISQALAGAQTEEEVLEAMMGQAGIYPQAYVSLALIDQEAPAGELTVIHQRDETFDSGMKSAVAPGTRLTATQFPLFQYIAADKAFVSPNLLADERADPATRELVTQMGAAGAAIIPITAGNEWLGIVSALSKETGYFDEYKVNLYQTLAEQGAEALRAARLRADVQKRAAELQTVAEVSAAAATILEPGELLQTVTDLTKSNFGLYHAHIYLLDEVEVDGKLEDTLVLASGAGEAGRQMVAEGWQIPLERETSLVARAARTRQGVIANDVQQAPDYMPNPLLPDTRSELAVPLIVGDRVLGVLDVQSDTADHFTDQDVQIQTTLAGQIATALQNADLFERTQVRLNVSQALADAQTIDEILEALIGQAGIYPQAQVSLSLVEQDASTGEVTFVHQRDEAFDSGIKSVFTPGMRLTPEQFPLLQHVTADKPFVSPNLLTDERTDPGIREMITQMGIASTIILPITAGNEWLGTIAVSSREAGYFDEYKINLYQTLADQGAEALRAARLRADVQKRAAELQTVAEVSTAAATILEPRELLQTVTDLTKNNFGLYHAHIYLLDEVEVDGELEDTLVLASGAGEAGRQMVAEGWQIPLERETSLVARAARTRQGVIANDVQQAPDYLPNPLLPDTRSELAVPLIVGDRVLGVLDVQSDTVDHFTDEDVQIQTTLAGQIATALQNADLFERTQVRLKVSQALAGAQTVDEVLEALIGQAGIYPQAQVGLALIEQDASTGEVTIIHQRDESFDSGIESAFTPGMRLTSAEFPLLQYITADKAFVSPNILADERTDPGIREMLTQMGTAGAIILPITAGNEWLGTMAVSSKEAGYFDEYKINLYQTLADQGAEALRAALLRAEVQETQERFRQMVEGSLVGIFRSTLSGEIIEANPAILEIMGLNSINEANEIGLMNLYVDPNKRQEMLQTLQAEGRLTGYEADLQHKDGTVVSVSFNARLMMDEAGKPAFLEGTVEDITERKQAEAETKRLASIVENSPDFIAMATPDGRASYVNPAGLEMIGYTLEEALASLDISSSQPDLPPEALETAMKEGVWSGETDLAHKDGHRIRILQVIAAVKDETGDIQHFTTVARDITERVQAEEEILKRAVELQTVAEVSTAAATILEPGELLQTVTDLTKNNFGLYHAHIYLLDEVEVDGKLEDTLVLASGAGEAGRQMVAEGWRIPLEREASLVARAARTRQGVIANDVQQAPDYMPNPLLPDTRSELAVPMIVGDRVLGVLDVQSDTADHFTDEDVQIQTTLAGQIATALQNANLFEEEARLLAEVDQIFNTSADAMRVVDKDFNMLRVNQTFATLTGVSVDEAAGKKCYDAFSGHACHTDDCPLTRILGGEESYEYEIEKERRDGTRVPCIAAAAPFKGPDGELIGIVEDFRDITERVQAEQELRRLGTAVEQSVDGIAVADMNGTIQFVNTAWAQMHGYSVEEFLGKPLSISHTEEQMQQEVGPANEQVIATGSHQAEIGHVRKDGTTFPTWMTIAVLTDKEGKPIGLVATARDITEQKKAEQALQENEERFRDVALSTSDWVWEVDAQGRYTYCSEKVLDVLGYTAEKMLGKTPFDAMPEEEAARVGEIFGEIVANKQPIVDLENRNITKDGREVYLLTNGTPILDGGGNLLGYRGVDKDITERVRAERERERFTTQLSTAAEIATQVSAILDPDELLNTVIALLKERFNLYYAHFYRLDETAGELVLSAGYGKPGRTMLKKGHSIPLDREQSLVAQAARSKESVVVHDVTQDPGFMPNPLLPHTKSEVAVPLISGGQVLGVFDVQHNETDYFTEGDLNVFSSLAGQVATAMRNASLFERLQESKA